MLEEWEGIAAVAAILLLAFPLRSVLFRHVETILSFALGAVVGRVIYYFIDTSLGYSSVLIMLFMVILFGGLFAGAVHEIIGKKPRP